MTKVSLFVIFFFAAGSAVGSYAVLVLYAGIFIFWHSINAYRRTIRTLQRIEYGLVTSLFLMLCILIGIGQQRKQDENWLLSHLNLLGGEINYNRLQAMTPLQNLCSSIKNAQVFNSSHFRNVEYLSKLAIEQNDCQTEIQTVFEQSKDQWLYIALLHMTPKGDPKWKELCNHHTQFKNDEIYKIKREELQKIEKRFVQTAQHHNRNARYLQLSCIL